MSNTTTRTQRINARQDKIYAAFDAQQAAATDQATARTTLADPRDGYPIATLALSAAEIQKRVNSHDALVEAVREAAEVEHNFSDTKCSEASPCIYCLALAEAD